MNDVWVATFPVVKKQRKIKTYMLCSSNDNVLPITAMINSNKRKKKKIAIFGRRLLKTVRTESNMLLRTVFKHWAALLKARFQFCYYVHDFSFSFELE